MSSDDEDGGLSPALSTISFEELMPQPPSRHRDYYISTGDVVFRVENNLFRVHRYFFVRESPVFREMLSMPYSPGTSMRGSSDANPIELLDVKSADFAHLLWIFYNPKYSVYDATVDDWAAILALAHMWQFQEVRELAIREMEELEVPPVMKAFLAQKYGIERDWAVTAYAALAVRHEPLTYDEGIQLGVKVALQIVEVRERIQKRRTLPSRQPREMAQVYEDQPENESLGQELSASMMSMLSQPGSRSPAACSRLWTSQYTPEDLDDVRRVFNGSPGSR